MDLKRDPPLELVVEIDITSRSVPREPIYAAMGVPEIWRYDGRKIECLLLVDGQYVVGGTSLPFPFLEPRRLTRFVGLVHSRDENSIVREFAAWVRSNGWTPRGREAEARLNSNGIRQSTKKGRAEDVVSSARLS